MFAFHEYMNGLAKSQGFDRGSVDENGWTGSAEKNGRSVPDVAVIWDREWIVWIGDDRLFANPGDWMPARFDHPHEAFAALRRAVDAYEWPVCDECGDTGWVRCSEDVASEPTGHATRDWKEPCECWHGKQAKPWGE